MQQDIKGYEGIYAIDTEGNVWSYRSNKYLKPNQFKGKKYMYVCLSVNGETKKKRIHRLVAEAFIPNPDNLPEVNHIDEDSTNNKVENLEWVTRKQNQNHGTLKKRMSEKMMGNTNQVNRPVLQYNLDGEFLGEWDGAAYAAHTLGITPSGITRCCQGKYKQSGGFIWKYKDCIVPVVD